MTSIYRLYFAGTADGSAALDIRTDGTVRAVHIDTGPQTAIVSGDSIRCEVSMSSSSQFTANDVRNVLSTMNASRSLANTMLDTPIFAGERLYLHVDMIGAGGTSWAAYATVFVEENADDRGRPRNNRGRFMRLTN